MSWAPHETLGIEYRSRQASVLPGVSVLVGELEDIPVNKCVTSNSGECLGWGGGQCGIEWSLEQRPKW